MTEREIDLLVAEDDPRDAALILAAIRETGSGATVRLARDGAETLGLLHGSNGSADRVELTLRIRAILAYWVEANHVPGSQ